MTPPRARPGRFGSPFVAALLLSAASLQLHAQAPDSANAADAPLGVIDTVVVAGNQKTLDYVILNEMALKPGTTATPALIEYDRNRIYSLGLFTRVDLYFDTLAARNFLLVSVKERWYIIPYPVFGFRDGDPKRIFYGAGILHNNFRGRNQKLYGSLVAGSDPSLSFSFVDPLLGSDAGLFFATNASFSRVRNKSVIAMNVGGDFDETHYNIDATIGKRFDLFQSSGIDAGYQIVQIPAGSPGRTASGSGRDGFLYGTVSYRYDSRDLAEYPSRGEYVGASITKYGFGESAVNFLRYGIDARKYVPAFSAFTLVGRVFGNAVSGGAVPPYQHVYFGYGERIRGYYTTVFEGEDQAGATLELRFPLLGPRVYEMRSIPLPSEFAVWRFGISLALFGDAGTTWFRGDRLSFRSFSSGYGAGADFLLPYSYVVRLEYAYNNFFHGQFILNLRGAV